MNFKFPTTQSLASHLQDQHQIDVNNQVCSFDNLKQFNKWKMQCHLKLQFVVTYLCNKHNKFII